MMSSSIGRTAAAGLSAPVGPSITGQDNGSTPSTSPAQASLRAETVEIGTTTRQTGDRTESLSLVTGSPLPASRAAAPMTTAWAEDVTHKEAPEQEQEGWGESHQQPMEEAEYLLAPGAGLARTPFESTDSDRRALERQQVDGQPNLSRLGSNSLQHVYEKAISEGLLAAPQTLPDRIPEETAPDHIDPPATPFVLPADEPVHHPNETEQEIPSLTLKQVASFALPALGAVLADPLMSLVDTACVGQISSVGLAALGPNTAVFGFVSMLFQFLTTATTAMVARAYSRGELKEMSRAVCDGMLLAGLMGTIVTGVLVFCSGPILGLLNTSSELLAPATSYMFYRALALPATLISMVGAAACLGQRDSATPLRVAGLSGLINLVVDLYLVMGPPQMGITGAAIATAGSQLLAAALYLVVLARRIEIKFRVPYWSRVKPFVTAGSVLTLRSICIMTSLSLMTTKAAALGTITIASHQVLVGVLTVAQFCPEPLSQAAQTFLANTASALRKGTCTPAERRYTKRAGRLLLGCAAASGVALAAAVMTVATRAPQMFTSDPAVMASMVAVAPQLAVVVLFYTCVCALDGLTFASGDMVYAASVQVLNLAVMAAALALLGGSSLGHIWYVLVGFTLLRLGENTVRTARYYFI